ncbi:unnamed protein product [Heligmosomoides polygyrus]|uniref:HOOK domain-containing protein n=1 Tax=Heligmosomoides polygyrus TaxID=6339 RepID=A0A3P8B4S6_HELPZ|nr:unnamed protein product [Heligmosomoides polygyrus]
MSRAIPLIMVDAPHFTPLRAIAWLFVLEQPTECCHFLLAAVAARNSLPLSNLELRQDRDSLELQLEKTRQQLYELTKGKSVEAFEQDLIDIREKKARLEVQVIETETEMELLKGKIDSVQQENEELRSKVGQIRPFEDEFRRLRDEVEELRVKEADHSKLQQAYEQLKNKAKDSSNDRAELLVLREKVKSYVEHGMLLEDEQRKNKVDRVPKALAGIPPQGCNDGYDAFCAILKRGIRLAALSRYKDE